MKKLFLAATITALTLIGCGERPFGENNGQWKLIFREEFNTTELDQNTWDSIHRGGAHWNRYMAPSPELIKLEEGNLVLVGQTRIPTPEDTTAYVTGGVWSPQKFSFTYGRIDIRAKVDQATGAWPALWLLPNEKIQGWPFDGEIDIMEHLNHDEFVHQTVHTNYTYNLRKTDNPKNSATAKINQEEYNVYSVERTPTEIIWYINGEKTHTYKKLENEQAETEGQWPFTTPFYVVLSQQLGGPGTWVGENDDTQLPVNMYIDYVRVFERR